MKSVSRDVFFYIFQELFYFPALFTMERLDLLSPNSNPSQMGFGGQWSL